MLGLLTTWSKGCTIKSSISYVQYVQCYKFAVHFYLPFHNLSLKFRVIVVLKLEVLRADCPMVGNPKQYPSGKLENKREELDTESVSSNAKLNCEAYSAGQCLKEFLTRRGMVTALQQPVMQVVDVSLMRSELKKFGRYHLILSDTVHTQYATLAPGLNHLVENILLIKGSIIRLLEFICDTTKSPRCESFLVFSKMDPCARNTGWGLRAIYHFVSWNIFICWSICTDL